MVWDHNKGHEGGNDKTLTLLSASLGGTTWPLRSTKPRSRWLTAHLTIPPGGTVTITFTFHQTYNASDGTEEILINLSTPGCEIFPIQAT